MYKKRAFRRYQTWKKYRKALRVVNQRWYSVDYTTEDTHRRASYIRDNLKDCSCSMCCNPRNNVWASNTERLTMQERRNNDSFNIWMDNQ